MKIRELRDVDITHVSYVSRGANKKQFLLTKSDSDHVKPDFEKTVDVFINKNDEKQLVYGVVYEPDEIDAHGDYMTSDEIEKSAHKFLADARNIDKEHDFNAGVGEVVESYIAPVDIDIAGQSVKKGTWLLVTKASEEIWKSIKGGEITGYSMAGMCIATEKSDKTDENEPPISDSFIKKIADRVGALMTKGLVKDTYDKVLSRKSALAAYDILGDILYQSNSMEDIRVAANDFSTIINEISYDELAKELEIKKGDKEVDKTELKDIVKESVTEAVTALVEKKEPEVKKEDEGSQPDIAEVIKNAISEAVKPIQNELDALKNSTGVSKGLEDEQTTQNEEDNVFHSLFFGGK